MIYSIIPASIPQYDCFNDLIDQLRIIGLGLTFPQICHSDRARNERRGIYSQYLTVKVNPNHKLKILTSGPSPFLRMTNFGDFKFIIYVTTPLRMTGLGLPFLQICHSDRETVRFRRGIYSSYFAVKAEPVLPTVDPHVASLLDGSFRIRLRLISKSLD